MATTSVLVDVIAWAGSRYGPVELVDRVALEGGVSGARVERVTLRVADAPPGTPPAVTIVVKHTDQQELDALTLLAELGEPAIPTLLTCGRDAGGAWIAIPWVAADPVPMTAEPPAEIGALMARIHAAFLDRPDAWPASLERIDRRFIHRSLTEFAPDSLRRLPDTAAAVRFRDRAGRAADRLLDDEAFLSLVDHFPATVLHGDLYGSNILSDGSGGVTVIDWNSARVGPGAFDIAMCSPSAGSPVARTYRDTWTAIRGADRDFLTELDWSRTLVDTVFAGTVAWRASLEVASAMLDAADAAYDRLVRGRDS